MTHHLTNHLTRHLTMPHDSYQSTGSYCPPIWDTLLFFFLIVLLLFHIIDPHFLVAHILGSIFSIETCCHGLPPTYINISFPFRTWFRTASPFTYITYLWNVLAFSRDFYKVPWPSIPFYDFPSPSVTFHTIPQPSSSFRSTCVYILAQVA